MQLIRRKIKELKKTNRGKAFLKLIYWGIFFLILLVFVLLSSLKSPEKKIENNEPPIIEEEKNEILDTLNLDTYNKSINKYQDSYRYNYKVIINDAKYIYEGLKTPTSDVGFKEGPMDTIKYYIDNTGTYKETTNERVIIDDLYTEVDSNYFDLNYYKNIIEEISFKLKSPNYLYEGTKDNIIYQIELDSNNNLNTIKVTTLEGTYTLKFREDA